VVGVCDDGTLRRRRSENLAPKRVDREVARKMLAAMGRGARGGSAASLRAPGRTLATKTGTADDGPSSDQTRSWLVAVVDGRWVVAAQVFVPYSTHQNLAVPLVQRAINGMGPELNREYRCPR